MSEAEGVQGVIDVLEEAGFERLPRPLTIVGTEFDFEAAARGTTTSHDLVLVATDQLNPRRLQRLIAGLARSLDLASSRRPVSVVVIGDLSASDRVELERYARVLPVPSSSPDRRAIEEAISVLLPLRLPTAEIVHGTDPINEVAAAIDLMRVSGEHLALIRAADDGPEAVEKALERYVNEGSGWFETAGNDDE